MPTFLTFDSSSPNRKDQRFVDTLKKKRTGVECYGFLKGSLKPDKKCHFILPANSASFCPRMYYMYILVFFSKEKSYRPLHFLGKLGLDILFCLTKNLLGHISKTYTNFIIFFIHQNLKALNVLKDLC